MKAFLGFINNILRTISKIFIVFAVFVVVINLFFHLTSSERLNIPRTDPYKAQREDFYKTFKDPKNQKSPESKLSMALYRSFLCGMTGEACTDNPADFDKNFDKSLFGFMTNLIVAPYANPPASGVYYVMEKFNDVGLFPKTYAYEGVGFASIRPLIDIWMLFRNSAYLILVLFIIAIGFMIMFRVKINPQTVISIENALPRIVISLTLITLSFAIAGFLIDLMYASIVIIISILSKVNVGDLTPQNIAEFQNRYVGGGFIQIWPYGNNLTNSANPFQVGNAFVEILPATIKTIFKGVVSLIISTYLVRAINTIHGGATGAAENVTGGIATAIFGAGRLGRLPAVIIDLVLFFFIFPFGAMIFMGLLFTITLVFFLFKIFFMLLKAYIMITLLIIFSPLILLFEALPGRNAFSWWFKNLIAELTTFPIFATISIIGYIIIYTPASQEKLFRLPFLYNIEPGPFATLVGMTLILMSPNIVMMFKELMGAKGIPGGFGPGVLFGGGAAIGGGLMGLVGQVGGLGYGISMLSHAGVPLPGWLKKRLPPAPTAADHPPTTPTAPPEAG